MVTPVRAAYPVYPASIYYFGANGYGIAQVSTDGTFTINVTQGTYTAFAYADGFIDYHFNFTVTGGNTTNVGDILLSPSAKVSGKLIGPDGEPIPSGELSLCHQSNGSVVSVTTSGPDGSFLFDRNVGTGTYYIRTQNTVPWTADVKVYNISATAGQTTSGIIVQLARSGAISGAVRSITNDPIEWASLYIFNANYSVFLIASTDSQGLYNQSWGLPAGTYNVSILYAGIRGYVSKVPDVQVVVQVGQTSAANFALHRSANISGTVMYSNGVPAKGVTVQAISYDSLYSAMAYTDENGRYAIDWDLGVADYTVMANYDYLNAKDVSITSEGQSVTGVDFVLSETSPVKAWIKGTVTSDGQPIWATVSANNTFFGWSHANGSYTIEVELPEGQTTATYNVTASKTGYYVGYRFPVTVTANQTVTGIDISLVKMPTGIVTGRVVSEVAPPKQDASLTLQYSFSGPYPVPVNSTIGLLGTLAPARSGPATLYWGINGSGFIYSLNGTVSNGAFSRDFVLNSTGYWIFKLVWHGDDLYNSATSNNVGIDVAAPVAPKQNVTLTLGASATNATVGTSITMSGSTTPSVSGEVSIYYSFNGSAYSLLANKTLTGGAYSHSFSLSQVGTYAFYATWPGNNDYNAATSATVAVTSSPQPAQKATPTVTISSSKTSVALDANHTSEVITITGTIAPFVASTTVNIRVTDPNGQATTIPVTASASTFSANATINKGGVWSIQAQVPEGPAYNAASSNTISVSAQAVTAGGGDSTALIVGGVVVALAIIAALFIFMRKKK